MTVYTLIEVVGTSGKSIDDAIRGAVSRAATSVYDLQWFEVKEIRGRVREKDAVEFQVKVEIGCVVHKAEPPKARSARVAASQRTRSSTAQLVAKKSGTPRSNATKGVREPTRKRSG